MMKILCLLVLCFALCKSENCNQISSDELMKGIEELYERQVLDIREDVLSVTKTSDFNMVINWEFDKEVQIGEKKVMLQNDYHKGNWLSLGKLKLYPNQSNTCLLYTSDAADE